MTWQMVDIIIADVSKVAVPVSRHCSVPYCGLGSLCLVVSGSWWHLWGPDTCFLPLFIMCTAIPVWSYLVCVLRSLSLRSCLSPPHIPLHALNLLFTCDRRPTSTSLTLWLCILFQSSPIALLHRVDKGFVSVSSLLPLPHFHSFLLPPLEGVGLWMGWFLPNIGSITLSWFGRCFWGVSIAHLAHRC